MEHDNSIRRLMLTLLAAGIIIILNMIFVVTGEANEYWSELHPLLVSLSENV
jgi:hypothetical protein